MTGRMPANRIAVAVLTAAVATGVALSSAGCVIERSVDQPFPLSPTETTTDTPAPAR